MAAYDRESTVQQTVRLGKELFARSALGSSGTSRTRHGRKPYRRRRPQPRNGVLPRSPHIQQRLRPGNKELPHRSPLGPSAARGGGAAGMWYLGRQGDQSPLANSVQVVVDSSPSRAPFRATAPMPFTIDEPAMYASPRSNAGRAQEEHERLTPGSVHGGVAMSENGRPTFTMNAPNVRIDDVGVSLMQQRRRSLADAAAADTTSHKKHSTGEDTHVIAVIEKVRRRRRSSVVAGVTRAAPASSDDEEAKLMEQPDPMLEYEDALRNVGQRQVLQEEWVKHHMKERRGFTSPLIEAEMALHSAMTFMAARGQEQPNTVCTAVAFEALHTCAQLLGGHRTLFSRVRNILLQAVYNDPPRGELQHLAFQRCSDAVPYFQSQRRHVAAMKALVTRHGRVRAKMEAMVIRKGANFLRWTRLVKYFGGWKKLVRMAKEDKLRYEAESAREELAASRSARLTAAELVSKFLQMSRDNDFAVLSMLLDATGEEVWKKVVTYLMAHKNSHDSALSAATNAITELDGLTLQELVESIVHVLNNSNCFRVEGPKQAVRPLIMALVKYFFRDEHRLYAVLDMFASTERVGSIRHILETQDAPNTDASGHIIGFASFVDLLSQEELGSLVEAIVRKLPEGHTLDNILMRAGHVPGNRFGKISAPAVRDAFSNLTAAERADLLPQLQSIGAFGESETVTPGAGVPPIRIRSGTSTRAGSESGLDSARHALSAMGDNIGMVHTHRKRSNLSDAVSSWLVTSSPSTPRPGSVVIPAVSGEDHEELAIGLPFSTKSANRRSRRASKSSSGVRTPLGRRSPSNNRRRGSVSKKRRSSISSVSSNASGRTRRRRGSVSKPRSRLSVSVSTEPRPAKADEASLPRSGSIKSEPTYKHAVVVALSARKLRRYKKVAASKRKHMPAANCLGLVYSMYELYIVEAYGPKALRNKNMSHIHDFTNFVQYYILQRFGLPSIRDSYMAGIMESVEASVSKRRLRMFGMISHILPDLFFHPQFHAIVMHLYHKLFPDFHGAFLRLHPDGTVFVRLSTAISAVKHVLVNKPAARILNVLQLSPTRRARFLQKVHMMATTAEEAGLGENGKILTNSNSESFQDIVKMLGHDPESHTQHSHMSGTLMPTDQVIDVDDLLEAVEEVSRAQVRDIKDKLRRMYQEFDVNKNGVLDFSEFEDLVVSICEPLGKTPPRHEIVEMYEVGSSLDTDGQDSFQSAAFVYACLDNGLLPEATDEDDVFLHPVAVTASGIAKELEQLSTEDRRM